MPTRPRTATEPAATLPLFPTSPLARARQARRAAGEAPRRRLPNIAAALSSSGTAFMRTALEFFNRPMQPERHEIAAVLAVTAWEKLMKAYLHRHTPFNIFVDSGRTVTFDECRKRVRHFVQLGGGAAFEDVFEHLATIESYRNKCVHFVGQGMDTILHGIFAESILKFATFLKTHFAKDLLPPSHVGVLPLGYSFPLTAADFLSKQSAAASAPREVVAFLEAMHRAGTRLAKLGVAPEHSILVSYRLGLVSQKNAARADDTLRVDNTNAAAQPLAVVREVDEKTWTAYYCLRYNDVLTFATQHCVKRDRAFIEFLKSLRTDADVFAARQHDPGNPKSSATPRYSEKVKARILDWQQARTIK